MAENLPLGYQQKIDWSDFSRSPRKAGVCITDDTNKTRTSLCTGRVQYGWLLLFFLDFPPWFPYSFAFTNLATRRLFLIRFNREKIT